MLNRNLLDVQCQTGKTYLVHAWPPIALGSPIEGHEAWNHRGAMEDHWMRSGATHNQISFFCLVLYTCTFHGRL